MPMCDILCNEIHNLTVLYILVLAGAGTLYMWGQNNQVIDGESKANMKYYTPQLIHASRNHRVKHVQCGAWHCAAVTGIPGKIPFLLVLGPLALIYL